MSDTAPFRLSANLFHARTPRAAVKFPGTPEALSDLPNTTATTYPGTSCA